MIDPTPTVFVVDDDASVRRALTRLLQSAGIRVLTYASATEFLDTGISSAPGCLILDIHLGGMMADVIGSFRLEDIPDLGITDVDLIKLCSRVQVGDPARGQVVHRDDLLSPALAIPLPGDCR